MVCVPAAPVRPDALELLTGSDAADLLAAALATAGGELVSWRARQVDHRPGASTTVSYKARVRWADGERDETLGASTGLRGVSACPPGVIALSDGEHQVAVWRFPLDPGLPGLAAACDPAAVSALLASFGVPEQPVRLRVRAYRPRRRAVVEAWTPDARLFVKVLRPSKVAELHHRHRMLHDAGVPVPRSLGWSDDGLLVLQALHGDGLRQRLRAGGDQVPSGADLLALLDQMPDGVAELPRRAPWAENAGHYARVIADALPAEAQRATQLAARIGAALDPEPCDAPTHGDLYESQLLLTGTRVTGLLDVDTAGPGRRADDLACLLAHLCVLAQMEPGHRASTNGIGARWLRVFDRRCDPAGLRHRVAGVVMSLATGPHRVQEKGWQVATRRRLDLVERWVSSAERVPG